MILTLCEWRAPKFLADAIFGGSETLNVPPLLTRGLMQLVFKQTVENLRGDEK